MKVNKIMTIIGIFVMVLFFQAAPSFAIMAPVDPADAQSVGEPTPSAQVIVKNACQPNKNKDVTNHGQYVKCVSQEVKKLYKSGDVSKEVGAAIISEAAKSNYGKKK